MMFSTLWKAAFSEKLEEKIHLWRPFFFVYGSFQKDLFDPWWRWGVGGAFAPIAPTLPTRLPHSWYFPNAQNETANSELTVQHNARTGDRGFWEYGIRGFLLLDIRYISLHISSIGSYSVSVFFVCGIQYQRRFPVNSHLYWVYLIF